MRFAVIIFLILILLCEYISRETLKVLKGTFSQAFGGRERVRGWSWCDCSRCTQVTVICLLKNLVSW